MYDARSTGGEARRAEEECIYALERRKLTRVSHSTHEAIDLVVVDCRLGTDSVLKVSYTDVDRFVEFAFFLRERSDFLVDSGNQDLSLRSDQLREECE